MRGEAGPVPSPAATNTLSYTAQATALVEPAAWSRGVARLSRSARTGDQGHYRRLGNLRRLMGPDGWLSAKPERIRRAMGTEVSLRSSEATLAFGVKIRVLVREKRGQKYQQAVYRGVLPVEEVLRKTVPVERWSTETGERLPSGRTPRLSTPRDLRNTSSEDLSLDVSARNETGSQPAGSCGPLSTYRDGTEAGPDPDPLGRATTAAQTDDQRRQRRRERSEVRRQQQVYEAIRLLQVEVRQQEQVELDIAGASAVWEFIEEVRDVSNPLAYVEKLAEDEDLAKYLDGAELDWSSDGRKATALRGQPVIEIEPDDEEDGMPQLVSHTSNQPQESKGRWGQ